jgi:hypothetical protein
MNAPDDTMIAAEIERAADEVRRRWELPAGERRTAFTTGQVAKICGVSSQTVQKWCNTDLLPSYRLAESHHRRVMRLSLVKFMHAHGIPSRAPELF